MSQKVKSAKVQSNLSLERTKMANRRTLLAYIRSSVGLVVAGAGLMKFISTNLWVYVGIGCVVLAPITLVFGIYDFFHVKKLISQEEEFLNNQ